MTYRLCLRIIKHIWLNVTKTSFFNGFSLQNQHCSPCRLLTNQTQKALVSMVRDEHRLTHHSDSVHTEPSFPPGLAEYCLPEENPGQTGMTSL